MINILPCNINVTLDPQQLDKLEKKLLQIELQLWTQQLLYGNTSNGTEEQIKQAIIKYGCDYIEAEEVKKKLKPYYRKGRWD